MLRQGKLHQDTVNIVTLVQSAHHLQQLFCGDGIGRRKLFAVDAELFTGFDLVADVNLRGRIVSGENHSESGALACSGERLHFLYGLRTNIRGDFITVENLCGHIGRNTMVIEEARPEQIG